VAACKGSYYSRPQGTPLPLHLPAPLRRCAAAPLRRCPVSELSVLAKQRGGRLDLAVIALRKTADEAAAVSERLRARQSQPDEADREECENSIRSVDVQVHEAEEALAEIASEYQPHEDTAVATEKAEVDALKAVAAFKAAEKVRLQAVEDSLMVMVAGKMRRKMRKLTLEQQVRRRPPLARPSPPPPPPPRSCPSRPSRPRSTPPPPTPPGRPPRPVRPRHPHAPRPAAALARPPPDSSRRRRRSGRSSWRICCWPSPPRRPPRRTSAASSRTRRGPCARRRSILEDAKVMLQMEIASSRRAARLCWACSRAGGTSRSSRASA
jgi:hypothetical protein